MDRGAWRAIQSMGSQRIRQNWATNTFTSSSSLVCTSRLRLVVPRGPLCNAYLFLVTPLKSQSRSHPAAFFQPVALENRKPGFRKILQETTHKEEKCLQSGFFQELFLECDFGDASLAFWFCTIQEIIRSQTPAQPQHHHTSEAQAGHSEFFFLWKRLNN